MTSDIIRAKNYIAEKLLNFIETKVKTSLYYRNAWSYISGNPCITPEFIEANDINKPWNWVEFSKNPNLTMECINKQPDKDWDWSSISSKPNITWKDIEANPDKPWRWDLISLNPNITMDIIRANPDKPWCYQNISQNPNLTMEFVNANLDKDEILNSHKQNTIYRAKNVSDAETLLAIQDTTTLSFTHHKKKQGMHKLFRTPGFTTDVKGFHLHHSFLITATGLPLGLLSQDISFNRRLL